MSAFMLIRDPDPQRREQVVRAAESRLRRMDMVTASLLRGSIAVVWGTFPGVPGIAVWLRVGLD